MYHNVLSSFPCSFVVLKGYCGKSTTSPSTHIEHGVLRYNVAHYAVIVIVVAVANVSERKERERKPEPSPDATTIRRITSTSQYLDVRGTRSVVDYTDADLP